MWGQAPTDWPICAVTVTAIYCHVMMMTSALDKCYEDEPMCQAGCFCMYGNGRVVFSFSKYSTAGPSSGSSVHLCRHDLLPHDTITCTTPSMPRLGETPYFPMQAGPKDLRGV